MDAHFAATHHLPLLQAASLPVRLADGTKLQSTQLATLALMFVDNNGSPVTGLPATWDVYVLDGLTSPVVLGMDWLNIANPKSIGLAVLQRLAITIP